MRNEVNKKNENKLTVVKSAMLIGGYVLLGLPWLGALLGGLKIILVGFAIIALGNIYVLLVFFYPPVICAYILLTSKQKKIVTPTVILLVFAMLTDVLLAFALIMSPFA
jgi:hypothetical protein